LHPARRPSRNAGAGFTQEIPMRFATPALAGLFALTLGAAALAGSLSFVQRGFSEGAELRFTVAGADLNGDGRLERENRNPIDEITGFRLTFSGNSLISPFILGLDNLLIFDLGLATLDFLDFDAVIFAGNDQVAYIAGGGTVGTDCTDAFFRCGLIAAGEIDAAASPLVAVPAPGAVGLFGLAVAALLGLRRRPAEPG